MYCVIDFETTGLSPYDSEVIEYAAVRVLADEDGFVIDEEVCTELCAPARTLISPTITRITGITPDMVEGLPAFEERLRDFLDFIGDDIVVAHNIPFDMGFLRRYCRDAGVPVPKQTLCTLVQSRRYCKSLPNHKLETVARSLGVDGEGYHRALADAITTAKVLIVLLDLSSTQLRTGDNSQPISHASSTTNIHRPSKQTVMEYLDKWKYLLGYKEQEDALHLLFTKTFLQNTSLSEVLVKCSTLNEFYGTNIFRVHSLAKHIVDLNIDSRLKAGDPQLVNDISLGHGIRSKSGKELHLFSFATKYCSHHNPNDFPIYDSYVEQLLIHFRNVDRFSVFRNEELRDYLIFKRVILDFRKAYQLKEFSLKQIDQYLWQLGKDVFPKQYGNTKRYNLPITQKKEVETVDDLVKRFNSDMENIYPTIKRLGLDYTPSYFMKMLTLKGGYQTAKQLIHAQNPQFGLKRLWELGHLELSVEAHVLKQEYVTLFTEDERRLCSERLAELGYQP